MECKKCGMPTVEGATFCGYCGERIDGKKACAFCGQFNDEGQAFCVYCGARIDGKKVCKNCGSLYETNFCPTCGYSELKKPQSTQPKKEKKSGKGLFAKILDIASNGSLMVGVIFAMIFVFFIGLVTTAEIPPLKYSESNDIFYFFGDFYKDMKDINVDDMGLTKWFKNLINGQVTTFGIIGTVLSALTILSVVAFGVVAIVKYILSWTTKTEQKVEGWAIACILSFFVGVALFFAYGYATAEMSLSGALKEYLDGDLGVATKFNGSTVTAIVFCAIFLGLGIIFNLLGKGKAPWLGKALLVTIFTLVAVLFAGVLLILAENSVLSIGLVWDIKYEGKALGLDAIVQAGFLGFNVVVDMLLAGTLDPAMDNYRAITQTLSAVNVYNLLSQLFVIALIVLAGLAVYSNVRGATGNKNSGLAWSICAVVVSVVLLVLTILAQAGVEKIVDLLLETAGPEANAILDNPVKGKLGVAICSVVFSVLLMALTIVRSVFAKKAAMEE